MSTSSASFDLTAHGLSVPEVHRNLAPGTLYAHAIRFEKDAGIAENGALVAYSGAKTGRSPKDKPSSSITQNTRGAYPIEFIQNAKIPCIAGHPIDAIHNGALAAAKSERDPVFGFEVVTECPGVPSEILIPRNAWGDKAAYDASAKKLAGLFIKKNFETYAEAASAEVKAAAPVA